VVLGGGIAGTFAALFLREAGFEVVGIGGELAYPLASLVLTQSMPFREDAELARRSLEIYRRFAEPKEVVSIDILPEWMDPSGLEAPHEIVDSVKGLRLDSGELALITRDHLVPVRGVVSRLRRRLGFTSSRGSLRIEGGRAHAVVDGERVEGDVVVLAAGHMNSAIARDAGITLPLEPYECYAALYVVGRPLWRYSIGDHVLGWYGRPAVPPLYAAGDGCGRRGRGPPPGYARRIAGLMRRRGLRALPLRTKVGHCEVGPHGGPLYGRHPGADNLYVLGGLDGYGSMVGPALAERLAKLVAGEGSDDAFRLERYLGAPPFDPCEVAERHDWGAVMLRGQREPRWDV